MIYQILYESLIAGLATLLGALIVLSLGKPGERQLSVLLGFAAGVMTAVVVLDLLPSALHYGNWLTVCSGFLGGLVFMFILDNIITLLSGILPEQSGSQRRFLKMGYLIAVGIALHDLPEGIAIAVGYTAQEHLGFLITLAIGLHNIPEGMATAAPLVMGGKSLRAILLTNLFISLFTPAGAALGLIIMHLTPGLVCLMLALAAGAMIFIVKNELWPEAHRRPQYGCLGFACGAILILLLSMFIQ